MSTPEWQKLRHWNGAQSNAFEELCCQLAATEPMPVGSKFVRKATPDAGVECFWIAPGGQEHGWQAKFFSPPMGDSQWSQLDNSVRTALSKHPKIVEYTVCLPFDRPDARIDGTKSMLEKWEERVAKWQGWATERNISISFDYWGNHEIFSRLSLDKHRGREFYWFNREVLTETWFKDRAEEAQALAGARYTPELNVTLPISEVFDGLTRDDAFFRRLQSYRGRLKRALRYAIPRTIPDTAVESYEVLEDIVTRVLGDMDRFTTPSLTEYYKFDDIAQLSLTAIEAAEACIEKLQEAGKQLAPSQTSAGHTQGEDLQYSRSHLRDLTSQLATIRRYVRGNEAILANTPALLLTGDAGQGKTHLLCDLVSKRVKADAPALLFLGEQFGAGEPWSQIINMVGLACSREVLIGALDAAAEARQKRALIVIDALNEGDARKTWKSWLPQLLTMLSRYPRIALAVSVRSSYLTEVIPDGLVPDRLLEIYHPGFAEHEYRATKTFFDHYKIKHPTVPLLNPEFENPLFLSLFCKGISKRGLDEIPKGLQGITSIFGFLIETVEDVLSKPERLDFDPKAGLVYKAVRALAQAMAASQHAWLPRDDAKCIVDTFLPDRTFASSLFRGLIVEGIIAEDKKWTGVDEPLQDIIRFTYERFTDHYIARFLLDEYLDGAEPSASFLPGTVLGDLLKDEGACYQHRGVLEAWAVQLPERIGVELPDIAPQCAAFAATRSAFVDSIIWRKVDAFTDQTRAYINSQVARHAASNRDLLDAFITVSSNSDHPFNAEFLHRHLMRLKMPDRDASWTIWASEMYGQHRSVDRIIDWAWDANGRSYVDDRSVYLCALTLTWFLTSSNRFLRDRATKGLVALLAPRLPILSQILQAFGAVDDLYVSERLYAVAYGCVMRSPELAAIGHVAQTTYDLVFKSGTAVPHILLRDNARGVVEMALHLNAGVKVRKNRIRPPYGSDWITHFPSEEDIAQHAKWREGMTSGEKASRAIYSSVMGFEDFARYVIGTNHGSFPWCSQLLSEPRKFSAREVKEKFSKSLTGAQERAWNQYTRYRTLLADIKTDRTLHFKDGQSVVLSDDDIQQLTEVVDRQFKSVLGKRKSLFFETHVRPNMLESSFAEDDAFSLEPLQRWIVWKVFDLGWSAELFGRYDDMRHDPADYRTGHKAERIGKKYQWLAYHELLARVADNFHYKGYIGTTDEHYDGPWQIGRRDIDPSLLIRDSQAQPWYDPSRSWWFSQGYDDWQAIEDDNEWVEATSDLPDIQDLIRSTDPNDGSTWLALDLLAVWNEPTPPGEERSDWKRRHIQFSIKGYVVKNDEVDRIISTLSAKPLTPHILPDCNPLLDVYYGEYFWSPAFKYHDNPYNARGGWTTSGYYAGTHVLEATEHYLCESSNYDCSINRDCNIRMPSRWITEGMQLELRQAEGKYYSRDGILVGTDPSVETPGTATLLMREQSLLPWLDTQGCTVMWLVLGEKMVMPPSGSRERYGYLTATGLYLWRGDGIEGKLQTKFTP